MNKLQERILTLDELCERITSTEVSEEELIARVLSEDIQLPKDIYNRIGFLSELHTRLRVEKVEQAIQNITIFYLKKRITKGDYIFSRKEKSPTQIKVLKKGRWNKVGEVDLVILLDRTPVIVETHMRKYDNTNQGVRRMLSPQNIEKKKLPSSLLFKNKIPEIIYVVPYNQVRRNQNDPDTVLYGFINERGGKIIPFPMTRQEMRKFAASIK